MLTNLRLERPLAILDLESTGTDPQNDRIVEISILRLEPDGRHDHRTRRINPGQPIPQETVAIHGITDADVADVPLLATDAYGNFLPGPNGHVQIIVNLVDYGLDLQAAGDAARRSQLHAEPGHRLRPGMRSKFLA